MRRDRPTPRSTLTPAPARGLSRRAALGALAGLASASLVGCPRAPQQVTAQFAQFATLVNITLWDTPARDAEQAIAQLQREYARLDRDWYAWGAGELGQLNSALQREVDVAVSARLGALLRRSLHLSQASGGLFDARIGPLVALWGFAGADTPARQQAPADAAVAAALAHARLQLDVSQRDSVWRVRAEAPGILIDLGGIAKGAILAEGLAILRGAGIGRALIDAGGDVAAYDDASGEGFRVGIRPARRGGSIRTLALHSGEVVTTSGDYARYRDIGGRRYAHIIDPRTGRPSQQARSATVVHRDATRADAAATALIVAGSAEFERVCDAMRVETALLVDNRGEARATPGMRVRLETGPTR